MKCSELSLALFVILVMYAPLAEGGVTKAWIDGKEQNVADLAKTGTERDRDEPLMVIVEADGELTRLFAVASKGGGPTLGVEIYEYVDNRKGKRLYSLSGTNFGRRGIRVLKENVKLDRRRYLIVVESDAESLRLWID
jgi:hypothetical protein